MKSIIQGLGMICAAVLVFALAMIAGAKVEIRGWLTWYLFALSLGTVSGMIALVYED